MNIILDTAVAELKEKFVVLELDSFCNGEKSVTAYTLIENIPLQDFATLSAYIATHQNLIQEYKKQNWDYCECAIKELSGKWNGELDSFYENLAIRVSQYQNHPPVDSWNPSLPKDF